MSFAGSLSFSWVCSVPGRLLCTAGKQRREAGAGHGFPVGFRLVLGAQVSPASFASTWSPPASWSPQAPALSRLLLTLQSPLVPERICLSLTSLPWPEGFCPPGTPFSPSLSQESSHLEILLTLPLRAGSAFITYAGPDEACRCNCAFSVWNC